MSDEPVCTVDFDAAVPCVVMTWCGYATSRQFRDANASVLAGIRRHGTDRLLGDLRDFVLIGADDQRWLNETWIPAAIDAGLRRVALTQPSFYFNRVAVETVGRRVDAHRLTVGMFGDLAGARAWLAR
jgi:hypothetical protein